MLPTEDTTMNPTKNTRPSHDRYDRDRGGSESGVNQVNPNNTENQGGDPPGRQGGDPGEVAPAQRQANRDAQPNQSKD
jgi:hypothetical protein